MISVSVTTLRFMKTKHEIIDETYAYYAADPSRRAMGRGGCVILTAAGRTCALGRCMLPEVQNNYLNSDGPYLTATDESRLDYMFQPDYRGHSEAFWLSIQSIHDKWCDRDEVQRREHVATLKEQYSND